MSTKTARRNPETQEQENEEARFAAWLEDFDARHAEMTARLHALLYSLGVDPVRSVNRDPA